VAELNFGPPVTACCPPPIEWHAVRLIRLCV